MNGDRPITTPVLPSTSKGIWILAAAVAISLHLACAAFAFFHAQNAESDDLGAPGIEIGVELMSSQAEPAALPPGPDSEASVASPAVAEQKTEVKEIDLPKETPVEAENPDRLVTRENTDKPNENDPDIQTKQTRASEESVAQEARAAPSIPDAPQGQKSVTLDQGTGESRQRVRVTWQKELLAHLDRHKRYPADRNQKAAEILLSLGLDRMGRVIAVSVVKGSGDESFDSAAIAMVQRASPVPPPPALVADEGLSFSLPVVFRAGGKR
jgi:periplasmic protein TonB